MNTRRFVSAFALALMISGFLTYFISKHAAKTATVNVIPVRHIVLASRDLRPGDALKLDDLETADWASTKLLPGAYEMTEALVGRVVMQLVLTGQPILVQQLSPKGTVPSTSSRIPEGQRAISVHADEASFSGGLLQPGSRVDIITTYGTVAATLESSTILQDVPVLAIGNRTDSFQDLKAENQAGNITLLVSPQDAEKLVLANARGHVTFAVRNSLDGHVGLGAQRFLTASAAHNGIEKIIPRHVAALAKSEIPLRNSFAVETIAGNKSTIQTFEGSHP